MKNDLSRKKKTCYRKFYLTPCNLLVLTDEICPNAILPAGLLPSTSAHLFYKLDLESYEYLEDCSHQWQVLPPSIVGNTSMSLNRWILQVFNINTLIHTCKNVLDALIPTFIIGRLYHVY
jgi:hypothetical protein